MIEILEDSIDFSKLGEESRKFFKADVKEAAIIEESRSLKIVMQFNYVLPVESIDKFKRSLIGRLKGIEKVDIDIEYTDLKQNKAEAVSN